MSGWEYRLSEIARWCCLIGLLFVNGLHYFFISQENSNYEMLTLFNLNAGIHLVIVYPPTVRKRQATWNKTVCHGPLDRTRSAACERIIAVNGNSRPGQSTIRYHCLVLMIEALEVKT
jgi:hypothetical protein